MDGYNHILDLAEVWPLIASDNCQFYYWYSRKWDNDCATAGCLLSISRGHIMRSHNYKGNLMLEPSNIKLPFNGCTVLGHHLLCCSLMAPRNVSREHQLKVINATKLLTAALSSEFTLALLPDEPDWQVQINNNQVNLRDLTVVLAHGDLKKRPTVVM